MSSSKNIDLLNQVVDVSADFYKMENEYFVANRLVSFDTKKGEGKLEWQRHSYALDWAFDKIGLKLERRGGKELGQEDYPVDPAYFFKIDFITARTVRIQLATGKDNQRGKTSLMLESEPGVDYSWKLKKSKNVLIYGSKHGQLAFSFNPWYLEFRNAVGQVLTRTHTNHDLQALHTKTLPFLFMRRSSDYSRRLAAVFSLSHDDKIFGCGESFTRLNKRGQKIVLWTTDAQSAASPEMYKPIPFFLSSRGYGMFLHSSAPATFDFGNHYDGTTILYTGDNYLDLFIFFGTPKEILSEYTGLTGRSPLPPVWSFGFWMSRFTYKSQKEVLTVAKKLRWHKIPCDVIHIDAGWFDHGWRCDFKFGKKTFPDPKEMLGDLKKQGFRTSLWQLPYFTPANSLYDEIIRKKLFVRNEKGDVPTEDVILDFSNPDTVNWYQKKIEKLIRLGVSVIKADFGESAPYDGYYSSGASGLYEHNLYPLRYTSSLGKLIKQKTGESIIWARSAWAGSQRYPVHWSGDPEGTDFSMAATLRAGLSLGLSGFSFWSHDIGGFSSSPAEELYRRWLVFGILTSHSRSHGFPPREPWFYSKRFLKEFRHIVELKYRLMPYIYTQAALSCILGFPMIRSLFFQYPGDATAWFIEDQYLFGEDILVAPLFESKQSGRKVYLPSGLWIDYQRGQIYHGESWHTLPAGEIPGIILVRSGSVIPHIKPALSTVFMDWNDIDLVVYATEESEVKCPLFLPGWQEIKTISVVKRNRQWILNRNPFGKKVRFRILTP